MEEIPALPAQLVEPYTGIAKVMGSNPVKRRGLNFFQALFQLLVH